MTRCTYTSFSFIVISYYLTDIFLQAGMSHAMAMLMAGVDSIPYFLGALTPIYTIDRFGRRALMYWGLSYNFV